MVDLHMTRFGAGGVASPGLCIAWLYVTRFDVPRVKILDAGQMRACPRTGCCAAPPAASVDFSIPPLASRASAAVIATGGVPHDPEPGRRGHVDDRDRALRAATTGGGAGAAGRLGALRPRRGRAAVAHQDALLHYQFETLHPFLDGNARLGRLLIVFVLVEHGPLTVPVLYLSAYLEPDRERYCEALQTGDPLPWIELFLRAVHSQATDAVARAPSHDQAPEVQRRGARRARGARSRRPRRARSRPPAELQRMGIIGAARRGTRTAFGLPAG